MLKQIPFLRLWVGTTASGLATWALPVVLGLGIIAGVISEVDAGKLLALRTIGFLAGVLAGGVLGDRFGSRQVVLIAGLAAAFGSGALAYTIGQSSWLALGAAALTGVGQGACRPAFQALIPQVVAAAERQQANALMTIAVRATTLLGPAATALLARYFSLKILICITGAAWLLAALSPGKTLHPRPGGGQRKSVFTDLADGFKEAWRHRWFISGLAALAPIVAFAYSVTTIVLPSVSEHTYGGDLVFTLSLTGYVLGALAGALVMTRWRPQNEGWVAFLGIGLYSLAPLVIFFTPHPIIVVGTYVLIGVGMELFNVPWFTATQREVAPDKLARVSAVDFLISYGLAPLGLVLLPIAIKIFGIHTVLIITTAIAMLSPLLAALVPGSRHLRDPRATAAAAV